MPPMSSFRFLGAPLITEPTEFGHKAVPIYTTLRDLSLSLGAAIVPGALVYALSAWAGLLTAMIALVLSLVATQQLRRTLGNAWPWELSQGRRGAGDSRGYLGGGRRRFAPVWINGTPRFLVGDGRGLTAFSHHGILHAPFGRRRPATVQRIAIVRGRPAFPEPEVQP
jgi:hypothetical protein